eukprot:4418728-Lingulodinium_polyedra.AAC.1
MYLCRSEGPQDGAGGLARLRQAAGSVCGRAGAVGGRGRQAPRVCPGLERGAAGPRENARAPLPVVRA